MSSEEKASNEEQALFEGITRDAARRIASDEARAGHDTGRGSLAAQASRPIAESRCVFLGCDDMSPHLLLRRCCMPGPGDDVGEPWVGTGEPCLICSPFESRIYNC